MESEPSPRDWAVSFVHVPVERKVCGAISFECAGIIHQPGKGCVSVDIARIASGLDSHVSRWLIASTNNKIPSGTIVPVG